MLLQLVYGDTETHSKGLAIPTYTYHGVYGKLRFLNRIDAAKHEYSSPYEIAAGWGWTIDNPQTINFPFSTTYDYGGGLVLSPAAISVRLLSIQRKGGWKGSQPQFSTRLPTTALRRLLHPNSC